MEATWVRRRDVKVGRLAQHPLIAGCSRPEAVRIARVCEEVVVSAGQTLARQGWMGNWLFLIDKGVADVVRDGRRIGYMWPGEYFGELELLGGDVNAATVRARTMMTLFVIHRPYFPALVEDLPGLRRTLLASLQARLGTSPAHISPLLERSMRALPEPADDRRGPATESEEESAARKILSRWEEAKARQRARMRARLRKAALALVVLGLGLAAASRYHPPLVVMAPGLALDLRADMTIQGAGVRPVSGHYLLTPVRFGRPSLLGVARDTFLSDREVLSVNRVFPSVNPSVRDERARAMYRRSRLVAAAAAARAAGFDIGLSGTGVRVREVGSGIPAATVLVQGDVIVAIDGRQVRLASELTRTVDAAAGRATLSLTVEREGRRLDLDVPLPAAGLSGEGGLFGIELETRDPTFRLPFEIQFLDREVTGASSGLAYALAIYDMLSEDDIAGGRSIAATGVIDPEGEIRAVGGIAEKAEASRAGGARLMLVPIGQVYDAQGHSVRVVGVRNLRDAISALRAGTR